MSADDRLNRAILRAAENAGLSMRQLAERAWPDVDPAVAHSRLFRLRDAVWLPKIEAVARGAGLSLAELLALLDEL